MFGIKASILVILATFTVSAICQGTALVGLHRYYNTVNGDHFYTINNENGLKEELAKINYKYEGITGRVFKSAQSGTLALHRYFNTKSGNHFYTTDWNELGGGKGDYVYQNIEGFLFPGPFTGTIPLYRYWNGKDHAYTTNWNELQGGRLGYKLEKIQGYLFP